MSAHSGVIAEFIQMQTDTNTDAIVSLFYNNVTSLDEKYDKYNNIYTSIY